MSGRPAMLRERETEKVIAVAKKAGAKSVEIRWGDPEVTAIIRLDESTSAAAEVEAEEQITL